MSSTNKFDVLGENIKEPVNDPDLKDEDQLEELPKIADNWADEPNDQGEESHESSLPGTSAISNQTNDHDKLDQQEFSIISSLIEYVKSVNQLKEQHHASNMIYLMKTLINTSKNREIKHPSFDLSLTAVSQPPQRREVNVDRIIGVIFGSQQSIIRLELSNSLFELVDKYISATESVRSPNFIVNLNVKSNLARSSLSVSHESSVRDYVVSRYNQQAIPSIPSSPLSNYSSVVQSPKIYNLNSIIVLRLLSRHIKKDILISTFQALDLQNEAQWWEGRLVDPDPSTVDLVDRVYKRLLKKEGDEMVRLLDYISNRKLI